MKLELTPLPEEDDLTLVQILACASRSYDWKVT
jgi:hypothetical protein